MADTLKSLISCCAGDDRPECPILQRLGEGEEGAAPVAAPTGAVRRRARRT